MAPLRLAVVAPLAIAAAACRSDGLVPAASVHPVAVSASTDRVEVGQGAVQLIAINVVRPDGFLGSLLVAPDSLPAGVLVQASADETADGITSLLLAVQADGGTAPGTYPVTIRAREVGGADPDGIASLAVVVTPPGSGEYTLQIRPVSVAPGSLASTTVSLTRVLSAFNLPVALSTDSLPPGISVTFSPPVATKATAGMVVAANASVAPGLYTVHVRGQVSGSTFTDRTASVPVVVRPAH